jgi:hypothetical protein
MMRTVRLSVHLHCYLLSSRCQVLSCLEIAEKTPLKVVFNLDNRLSSLYSYTLDVRAQKFSVGLEQCTMSDSVCGSFLILLFADFRFLTICTSHTYIGVFHARCYYCRFISVRRFSTQPHHCSSRHPRSFVTVAFATLTPGPTPRCTSSTVLWQRWRRRRTRAKRTSAIVLLAWAPAIS